MRTAPAAAATLVVSLGQCSDAGAKAVNQDFHGAIVPTGTALALKGVAVALADGISSSSFGQIAAQAAVKGFLSDYYCTADTWTVKSSARRVIEASNAWLHAQSRRGRADDPDHGHVTTFSALVLKGRRAHLFHVGDARVSRLDGASLERLTEDHRVFLSSRESRLGRALGVNPHVEIDYRTLPLAIGEVFLLTTDGVHEHVPEATLAAVLLGADDLDVAARAIVDAALANGSDDNLTVQIVRVERLPGADAPDTLLAAGGLPRRDTPSVGERVDGWRIEARLHASSRSHVFAATDVESGARAVLKFPTADLLEDPEARRRLLMEEWIARRLSSPHLLRATPRERPRTCLYTAMEPLEGRTLRAWMAEHRAPALPEALAIVSQAALALQAMHRRQTIHRDLRPENLVIDATGHVTLIDFGATRVAGTDELAPDEAILGTHQYTAPEVLLGDPATEASDLYALGAIAHELLSGSLPYGARMAQARTAGQQRRVPYLPLSGEDSEVPAFVDTAVRRAVHPDPRARQAEVAEFVAELTRPPAARPARRRPPLERHPERFWQAVSLVLALLVVALAIGRWG